MNSVGRRSREKKKSSSKRRWPKLTLKARTLTWNLSLVFSGYARERGRRKTKHLETQKHGWSLLHGHDDGHSGREATQSLLNGTHRDESPEPPEGGGGGVNTVYQRKVASSRDPPARPSVALDYRRRRPEHITSTYRRMNVDDFSVPNAETCQHGMHLCVCVIEAHD